jgi:predicted Fe-Mo cluster-binding NifX family protein
MSVASSAEREAEPVVAVPLFGDQVAPRFCFATEILVAEVEGGEVRSRQRVTVDGLDWPQRIRLLNRLGVRLVLASGFNRQVLPMARAHGIEIIWGLTGSAEDLLRALCNGELTRQPVPRGEHR